MLYRRNRDWLLRMIEDMGKVLAKVLGLQLEKDYAGAASVLQASVQSISGVKMETLMALPIATLKTLIGRAGEFDPGAAYVLATMVREQGVIHAAEGYPSRAQNAYRRSLELYAEALEAEPELCKPSHYLEVEKSLKLLDPAEATGDLRARVEACREVE